MRSDPRNITGLALVVAMGGFLLGFDATVISGAVGPISRYFALNGESGSLKLGWAVSCLGWGAMAGNLLAGVLNDRFGRRAVLLLTALLFLCSAQLAAFSTSFGVFVSARICGGIAVGIALLTAPVYIAEISPARRRGALVSLNQLMIVFGISVSYFSNFFLLGVGPHNWRWMLGVQALPALAFLLLLIRVPESPRWLLTRGRAAHSLAVLSSLHGAQVGQQLLVEIQDSLRSEPGASRIGEVLGRRLRFVLLFSLGIAFFQQITGINAIFYYLPTIFAQVGGGQSSAYAQAALVGVVNVGMTFVAIRLIDRLGRRPLLMAGVSGMALALLTISWAFHAAESPGSTTQLADARLVLGAIIVYVACFAISLGPVMWVLLSEIFPNEQRAAAIAVVGFWNSLVSASVTFIFPWELARFGPDGTFLGYGLLAVAGLLFLAGFAPETKGRSLEQLESLLARPVAP
ncbi:MAG: sugar porter family MFS transporter [Gammaproteobacteria bacterium]|nr:sugar porter family MFS transporter [Gammaproteobacteria bacterium]